MIYIIIDALNWLINGIGYLLLICVIFGSIFVAGMFISMLIDLVGKK